MRRRRRGRKRKKNIQVNYPPPVFLRVNEEDEEEGENGEDENINQTKLGQQKHLDIRVKYTIPFIYIVYKHVQLIILNNLQTTSTRTSNKLYLFVKIVNLQIVKDLSNKVH